MVKKELVSVKIVSQTLVSTSKEELLAFLVARVFQKKKISISTPNPEFVVFAKHNLWFKKILGKIDVAIPDGVGLVWAGKMLGQPIKERISGTDLMEKLCEEAAKRDWTVYLIGGKRGVAKRTLWVLKKRFPGLKGWAETGPKFNLSSVSYRLSSQKAIAEAVKRVNLRKPDLLFVAFGMGKQEKFIADNWDKLKVKLAMGVGGAFDYFSGQVPRAPRWMREAGLEWLYRLFRQPWRWRRQLRLIEFVWIVFKEKFT